jgi:predicted nucleic acid-binding protein
VIVVDTSVWVTALRNGESQSARTLRALLDADEVALPLPVRIELLSGVSAKDRAGLTRALRALPVLVPDDDLWAQVERWTLPAAAAGSRFSVTDLLIAAAAHSLGGLLWSEDDDFARMETLGMVQRYVP